MAAACCGIENNLGALITPVRACFVKAEEDYLGDLREGINVMPDGEEIYFISSPSAGLWSTAERLADRG